MPVISLLSNKGGTGKTMLSLLLANVLVEEGADVAVIDLDPLQFLTSWGRKTNCPPNLKVIGGISGGDLPEEINFFARQFSFVVVDCATRSDSQTELVALLSDLVIIPMEFIKLELEGVKKMVKTLQGIHSITGIETDVAVVLNRRKMTARSERTVSRELEALDGFLLNAEVERRPAFEALYKYGGALSGLGQYKIKYHKEAYQNASAFAAEVVARLELSRNRRPVDAFSSLR